MVDYQRQQFYNSNMFKDLLQELKDSKIVKVTGSYADGTERDNSDIDFYVKRDKADIDYNKRNILKIISILNDYDVLWESPYIGYIVTINLSSQLEFSDLFIHRKGRLKEVKIEDITFCTW